MIDALRLLLLSNSPVASPLSQPAPSLGAELATNGSFAADASWTKGSGWTIAAGVASHAATASSAITQTVATIGNWYQIVVTLTAFTSSSGVNTSGLSTALFRTSLATYTYAGIATATALGVRGQSTSAFSVDDISIKLIATASLFSLRQYAASDVNARVNITLSSITPAGIILCADSLTSPSNYLHAYLDGAGFAKLDKVVAGTRTNLINGAVAYVATQSLRAIKSGTSVSLYYAGTQVGTTQTVSDVGVISNTIHGTFSTNSSNILADFGFTSQLTIPALTTGDTITAPSPDVIISGAGVGILGGTAKMVFGSGTDLLVEPTYGTVTAVDATGATVWTYNSPSNDYAMGLDVGDVDGDGNNEVLVGFRIQDHMGALLDKNGNLLWSYALPADHYCRSVKIGNLRSDYAGQEIVLGGRYGVVVLLDKDGNLIWTITITDPFYTTVQSLWIADADLDGQNEIYIANGVSLRKHRASDGAELWRTTIGYDTSYCYGIAAGKVTSNPGLQIVGCNEYAGVFCLDQNGTVIWSATGGPIASQWSVALADIDGDGYQEVFVGYGSSSGGGVILYDHDGHALSKITLSKAVKFVTVGDSDADGAVELIASSDDGVLYVVDIA